MMGPMREHGAPVRHVILDPECDQFGVHARSHYPLGTDTRPLLICRGKVVELAISPLGVATPAESPYLERGRIDGIFGNETWDAVVALQGWEQIHRDGDVCVLSLRGTPQSLNPSTASANRLRERHGALLGRLKQPLNRPPSPEHGHSARARPVAECGKCDAAADGFQIVVLNLFRPVRMHSA